MAWNLNKAFQELLAQGAKFNLTHDANASTFKLKMPRQSITTYGPGATGAFAAPKAANKAPSIMPNLVGDVGNMQVEPPVAGDEFLGNLLANPSGMRLDEFGNLINTPATPAKPVAASSAPTAAGALGGDIAGMGTAPSGGDTSDMLAYLLASAGAEVSPPGSFGRGLGQGVKDVLGYKYDLESRLAQIAARGLADKVARSGGEVRDTRTASIKEYEYYKKGGGTKTFEEFLNIGKGKDTRTGHIKDYEYYKAGGGTKSFEDFISKPSKEKTSITWSNALSALSKGFDLLYEPDRQTYGIARGILSDLEKSGMDPMDAVNEADRKARVMKTQIEEKYRYYIDEANKKGRGTDVQDEIDRVKRTFLERYGYIPR